MRAVAAVQAFVAALVTGAAAAANLAFGHWSSALVDVAFSVAFAAGGVFAILARMARFRAGVWAASVAYLLFRLFFEDGDGGMMDGGLAILLILVYLVFGSAVAIFNLQRGEAA